MSQFEVLSKGSCAQASWFCKGVVRKTNLPYLLKTKEMIMPGIMSEGSRAESGPRYVKPPESRCRHPSVWDQPRSGGEFEPRPETGGGKAEPYFAKPGEPEGGAG